MENARKISVSLPTEWLRYTEIYRKTHGLSSRSEVIVRAMEALRERELAEATERWQRSTLSTPMPCLMQE